MSERSVKLTAQIQRMATPSQRFQDLPPSEAPTDVLELLQSKLEHYGDKFRNAPEEASKQLQEMDIVAKFWSALDAGYAGVELYYDPCLLNIEASSLMEPLDVCTDSLRVGRLQNAHTFATLNMCDPSTLAYVSFDRVSGSILVLVNPMYLKRYHSDQANAVIIHQKLPQ